MRAIFAVFLALALTLMPPVASAPMSDAAAAVPSSCHDMGDHRPDRGDRGRACADHCLSQVNASARFERLTEPSVQNAISAPLSIAIDASVAHRADPPDTPPPRV